MVLCLTPDIDPDLRSGFQSGSRPSLNSFLLWSLPPYSPNFIKIRQVIYKKHWFGSQIFKIRPVVYEKPWSGSQIRISIRITPNFELGLPMIITSLLTKIHQNPTSSLWEILLTNKQTDKQINTRRWLQYPAFSGITNSNTSCQSSKNYFQRNTPTFLSQNLKIPSWQLKWKFSFYSMLIVLDFEEISLCLNALLVGLKVKNFLFFNL